MTHAMPSPTVKPLLGPTVWHEFTPLSVKHKSVNLGQGFPDWPPPPFVTTACRVALEAGDHDQYARSAGHPLLTKAIAERYTGIFSREVDPDGEIVVSVGASQTLYTVINSICSPGDEIVLIEPAFDIYGPQVTMAGAKPVYVPLVRSKDGQGWELDMEKFRKAVDPKKTRAIIVNSPHNPAGKVYSKEELKEIADVVLATEKCIVITDDVYEHITYPGHTMEYMGAIPGMFDRTITISSAGKTFSVTGWKIGWAVGPKELISIVQGRHQWMSFSVSTPQQVAIASVMEIANQPYEGHDNYYDWLKAVYTAKRDHLVKTLRLAGLDPIVPQGSFFVLADITKAKIPESYLKDASRDYAFCRWLTCEIGVTAIPPSAFYCDEDKHIAQNLARFAFCKEDSSLEEARKRMLAQPLV